MIPESIPVLQTVCLFLLMVVSLGVWGVGYLLPALISEINLETHVLFFQLQFLSSFVRKTVLRL